MEKWMMYAKRADFAALADKFQIDQVLARIMVNRDVVSEQDIYRFLHPSLADLGDERQLKGMERAVSLLHQAIVEGKKIRIIGDYDADGIQSTYILKTALKRCGADVDYAIPDRVEDGYGINASMVRAACDAGMEVILTCDNGIAAVSEIALAVNLGMTVIVTDHHEIPFSMVEGQKKYHLPLAQAIVNPKQPGCGYPFKNICGATVAWKLVLALYETFGIPREEAFVFLENAAFATVTDVMELKGENRSIVALGLKALESTKNIGMAALISRCGLADRQLSAYHIGFVLGPCLNATGRLDSAIKAIELLEAEDAVQAAACAQELQTLNEERKAMTLAGVEQAEELIKSAKMEKDQVLVLYLPTLHESLAGIVAGRIKEKYYRPVFVLTNAREGVKGSGRSIPEYSMYEKLCECGDLLGKFGGHPMAAGLSLEKENIPALRKRLNALAELSTEQLTPKVMIDVPMPLSYVTPKLIGQLDLLEPFGCGNPKPVFAQKEVLVKKIIYIGKQKNFLKLMLETPGTVISEGLYFGDSAAFETFVREEFADGVWDDLLRGMGRPISLAFTYYPQMNEFRGKKQMQIIITGYCKS